MPKAPRKLLTTRVSPDAHEWIESMAAAEGAIRADVVRAMLSVATQHPDQVRNRLRGLSLAEGVAAPRTATRRGQF